MAGGLVKYVLISLSLKGKRGKTQCVMRNAIDIMLLLFEASSRKAIFIKDYVNGTSLPKEDLVLKNIFSARLEVLRGPRNSFVTLEFAKMNIFNARLNDE